MEEPFTEPDQSLGGILISAFFQPFSTPVVIILLVILLLLFMSTLVTAGEIAFFSLTQGQMKGLRSSADYRNRLLANQLERPVHLMATLTVVRNMVHIAVVVLAFFVASQLIHPEVARGWTLLILIVLTSSLILLFAEIIPSVLVSRNSIVWARFMAAPVFFLANIVYPISVLLIRSSSYAERRLLHKMPNLKEPEIAETIEMVTDTSTPEEERNMIKGIVKFGNIEVKEIMRSRMDVTAVETKTGFRDLLSVVISSGYSRIPVYQGTLDSIQGILYVKDLLPHLDKEESFEWINLIRPAFFIPENQRINALLTEFQDKKIHMAIVVDEYGGTSGIVTLEDIIEEIVGEINDEYDTESDAPAYSVVDEDTFVFEGKTSLNDFYKIVKIDDSVFNEVRGESDTLAGLVLEILGKLPDKGEKVDWGDFSFTIDAVDNRRIKRIKVHFNEEHTK